jgi:hypothetical protein
VVIWYTETQISSELSDGSTALILFSTFCFQVSVRNVFIIHLGIVFKDWENNIQEIKGCTSNAIPKLIFIFLRMLPIAVMGNMT